MSDSETSDLSASDSDSSVSTNEYSFTWKIDNYSLYYRKVGKFIKSPMFTTENYGSCMWYLRFYPKGFALKDKKIFSLSLTRCKRDPFDKEVTIRYKFKITNGNRKKILHSNISTWKKFGNGTRHSSNFIDRITSKDINWKEDTLTVNCIIQFEEPRRKFKARTKIIANQCSFSLEVRLSDSTTTKEISFSETSIYVISVSVQDELVKIEIRQLGEKLISPKCVSGRISLLNVSGVTTRSKNSVHVFESLNESNIWEFPPFFTKQDLEEFKKEYLRDNSFTLFCEFSTSNGMHSTKQENFSSFFNLLKLQDDLQSMLTNKKHCDVQLQVGDKTFPAHKSLLAARSPVFSGMFDQDMQETQSGIVNISDVEADIMRSFLDFMYTGKVGMKDSSNVCKLMLVADKYQVEYLKEKCSNFLLSSLSVENVCRILVMADLVDHKSLKQCSLDFIATHMTAISSSSEWPEWIAENNRLLNEILLHVAGSFNITRKN